MLSGNLDAQIVHVTAFNSTSGVTMWRSPTFPIPVASSSSLAPMLTRARGLNDDNVTDDGNSTDDTPAPSDDSPGTDDSSTPVSLVTCSNNGLTPTESALVFSCAQIAPSPPHEGNFIVSLRASDGKTMWIADL
jgi:hypothetical protein